MARNVMNQVREHGKVVRGYLGVLPEDIIQLWRTLSISKTHAAC